MNSYAKTYVALLNLFLISTIAIVALLVVMVDFSETTEPWEFVPAASSTK